MTLRFDIYFVGGDELIFEESFFASLNLVKDRVFLVSNKLVVFLFVILNFFGNVALDKTHLFDGVDLPQLVHILKSTFIPHHITPYQIKNP